ncbi:MAG: class I SAM-dependent methyltransferase [Planctomycetota bacterium]
MTTAPTATTAAEREAQRTFWPTMPPSPLLHAKPRGVAWACEIQAQLLPRERLFLYATIMAKAPMRVLEIGAYEGYSSSIIDMALRDLGANGRLVSVDPAPCLDFDWEDRFDDRASLVRRPSPDGLSEALERSGGPFEFVFVDGDHEYEGVLADLRGVAEVTAPDALIVLHDAYYEPLQRACMDALAEGLPYIDAGIVCTTENAGSEYGRDVSYCGLRMLRRTGA